MQLITSLAGRVNNTSLPKTRPLLALSEALVNSIQSIDAMCGSKHVRGHISIYVERSDEPGTPGMDMRTSAKGNLAPIWGFRVEDDGEGFTDANLESFQTLDTDHKGALGCRGVGRILWLKAFDSVQVSSLYSDDSGRSFERAFSFTIADGVSNLSIQAQPTSSSRTVVVLSGFKPEARRNASKTALPIARELLTECLWYFLRPGGAPKIRLIDQDETISFDDLFTELASTSSHRAVVEVKGEKFDLTGLFLRSGSSQPPKLYWCAGSRVVTEENISGRVPGLHGRMNVDGQIVTYAGFLTSGYLDKNVRSDRTAFDIIPSTSGTLISHDEISMEDIRNAAYAKIREDLAGPLEAAQAEGKRRVSEFVRSTAPRYRAVLGRFDELAVTVDPQMGDQELEQLLHREFQRLECDVLVEGQAILAEAGSLDPDLLEERVKAYLSKAEEVKQSDLAAYVARRRVVLDILRKILECDEVGRYQREDVVHSLVMPMRTNSSDLPSEASNLWIIDERLAFHDYLASDKKISASPLLASDSKREPDLLALQFYDVPMLVSEGSHPPFASIVVVEFKRPMRNDAISDDKNPISQALSYLEKVRSGLVKTPQGRAIPPTDKVPGYCYIIADLTPTMVSRCKDSDLRLTQDGMGYFGYNSARHAYVEVFSYDRLIAAATERNRAFFDKLGLPAT
jgi:hypothetical protein